MKKTQTQLTTVTDLLAGRRKFDNAKLETLNRTRLDTLGDMLQAQHFADREMKKTEAAVEKLKQADAKLRERTRTWKKTDRAFWSYLERAK